MKRLRSFNRVKVGLLLAGLAMMLIVSGSCRREGQKENAGAAPTARSETNRSQSYQANEEGTVLVTFDLNLDFSKHKVTFIELGAERCLPCRAMQPIMREIAKEYAGKIQVVFYDVWKDPRPARKYGIQLIPTQVFIDQNGKEIFRHVGYFPKEEILQMLKAKGIL